MCMKRSFLFTGFVLAFSALSCTAHLDEHFLKFEKYPGLSSKTRTAVVMPPAGYAQYVELPKGPYFEFWRHAIEKLDQCENFRVLIRDTGKINQAIKAQTGAWEMMPEQGAAKAAGKQLGADAAVVIRVDKVLTGHKANDPDQPMYYETVLITDIYDTNTGKLLYHARSRGVVYEDLAGSLNQAVDRAFSPLQKE